MKKKVTVLGFTMKILRVIPRGEHELIKSLLGNLELAVEEQGHNALSIMQMGCILGKHFGEKPKGLGLLLKGWFERAQFVDDEEFSSYQAEKSRAAKKKFRGAA